MSDPTRAVYNHVWLIGDQDAISVGFQAQVDDLAEVAQVRSGSGPTPSAPPDARSTSRRAHRSHDRDQEPAPVSEAERPDRLASAHRTTVEDIRALAGPSTPHFALQIRNRIQRLIDGLDADDPVRVEGERQIARLEELARHSGDPRGVGPGTPPAHLTRAGLMPSTERPQLDAVDRAVDLLGHEAADRAGEPAAWASGYLDLIGGELASTGATQDLMTTRFVPAIYERYWRPGLARAVKGITGPGMAEEIRIARLMLGLGAGDVVLDVACGPGNFTREFAHTVGDEGLVVGIDASPHDARPGGERSGCRGPGERRADQGRRDRAPVPRRGLRRSLLLRGPAPVRRSAGRARRDATRARAGRSDRSDDLGPPPADPATAEAADRRASGMRIFESDEIVDALSERGFRNVRQRLAGMVQFVGGRLE